MIKIPLHEGYLAAYNNKNRISDNPYDVDAHSEAHFEWDDGYMDACKDIARRESKRLFWNSPLPFYVFALVATLIFTLWCIFL